MKYLVVGSLPPPRFAHSVALLSYVDALEAAGHEVELVPVGVGPPGARTGGWRARAGLDVIGEIVRRAGDADTLVVQVEPALVGSLEAGRLRRAASLAALAGALRRWHDVEIRIESFDDLPGGIGGRVASALWRRASRVVVPTPEQRDLLGRDAGLPLELIEVAPPGAAGAGDLGADGDAGRLAWPKGKEMSRDSVLAVVRRRAAAERVIAGHHPSEAVSRLLAEADDSGPPRSPYGPLEPFIRFVYERPALREPVRAVLRVLRPAGE